MAYKDKVKQNEYQRLWTAKKRKEWFEKNGPCIKCGSWDRLELDHIDPKLKVSHRIWSWSEERLNVELSKCQILCNSCHLAKTIIESRKSLPDHGTLKRYKHNTNPCRCKLCKEVNASYEYNRRNLGLGAASGGRLTCNQDNR